VLADNFRLSQSEQPKFDSPKSIITKKLSLLQANESTP